MQNPFQTLGLTPTFGLDAAELEQRQRELNRALHPDRHAGKSSAERRLALGRAMDINQAYRTLRDPASRAEALFELLGAHGIEERSVTDPVLLGEMLEQRELLDEVRRDKDLKRLGELKEQMLARERQIVSDLTRAFEVLLAGASLGDDAPRSLSGPTLERPQRLYTELKYVRRFGEEVAAIEDEI
jgi:molecular chaperone HscB